jgi:ketosteroid isomerase-like protein
MIRWHRTSTIHASADEAFDVIGTHVIENHPRWEEEVLTVRKLTADPVGLGTRAVVVRKEMGRVRESEYEVAEFVPGKVIAFVHPNDSLGFTLRFELTPVGAAECELAVDVAADPRGVLRIAMPMLRLGLPRRSRRITDAMIAVIEGAAGAPSEQPSNAELVAKGYNAFAVGDIPTVLEIFDEGITWHVPGCSPLSGDFAGHDGVLDFFGRCQSLSGGTLRIDVDEILADRERVVVLCTISAQRAGQSWSSPEVHVWRVANGRAVEFREFQGDQQTEDAFWCL